MNQQAVEPEAVPTADPHSGSHVKLFMAVFGGLCVLTLGSFLVANSSLMDTPAIAWTVMMAISCTKAFLVVCYFMHLKWETGWKFVLTIPATVMSILLCLMLFPDIVERVKHYNTNRLLHAAEPNTSSIATERDGAVVDDD